MALDQTPNIQKYTAYAGTGNRISYFDPAGNMLGDIPMYESKLSDVTAISLLTTDSNWSSAGAYTGSAITGTYQGQWYNDSNFYFFAVANNSWIRLPRTSDTAFGTIINKTTAKTTPVDADMVGVMDSAASNILKKLSWSNIKATLKTYFDTLYASLTGALFSGKVSVGGSDMTPAASDRMTIGVLNTLPSNAVGAFIAWANSGVSQAGDIVIIPRSTLEGNVKIYAVNGTTPTLIGTFTKNGLSISGSLTASNGLISNITAKNGTALPSDYPTGITTMEVEGSQSGWPVTNLTVITIKLGTDRILQIASNISSPHQIWIRNKTVSADTWNGWSIINGDVERVSVTGTDSLELADKGKIIEFSSASNFTFTLDQMYDGFNCTLVNINTGDVTLAAGSGVTIRHESANRKLTTQYRGVSLYYRSATEVVIVGTLEA